MQSVFAAVGAGGVISPVLAAWAPNILFGAAAVYMMLTVRT
jgi:lipopolysaccharide export LptBFGC system permease protein LptF